MQRKFWMVIWREETNSATLKNNIKMNLWQRGGRVMVVKDIGYDGMKWIHLAQDKSSSKHL
jgi:hypothetical protein